jgi:hypothetical protein
LWVMAVKAWRDLKDSLPLETYELLQEDGAIL